MDDSNILAIPHHPPLPRTISGVFQADGHAYISASEAPQAINASAGGCAMGKTQMSLPLARDDQPMALQTSVPETTTTSHVPTSGPVTSRQFLIRHRGSMGSLPSEVVALRNSGSFAHHARRSSVCQDYSIDSGAPTRRESVASLILNKSTTSSQSQQHRPAKTDGVSPEMPLYATFQHNRRGSMASTATAASNPDKSTSAERKYSCEWRGCGQSFDRIEHLNRHKRRHTGEKPYRCLVSKCAKLFSRFDNMMQHVGIHTVEGLKTEIPNIKNSSVKGNGRGRARRTSYRGTQDPAEKFRRHVEGILGPDLARCCHLPPANPDYSNLTLRPLLNTDAIAQAQMAGSALDVDDYESSVPLAKTLAQNLHQQQHGQNNAGQFARRPRCDSLVDDMDKQSEMTFCTASSTSPSASPTSNAAPPPFASYRLGPLPPSESGKMADLHHPHTAYHGMHQLPTIVSQAPSSTTAYSILTAGMQPKASEMSNVRSQPGYRRECHPQQMA
ncbi:hypothetical protein FBU59_000306 [Linderina macrospora]|uniref:Uncharacterized protein n=1 Tax=Linderina macrospora TaxID=4868 RepID=A0ACC1JH82_9FUNG|nr:hypothetical protein FBU59_000306 [Linderina macrospora]